MIVGYDNNENSRKKSIELKLTDLMLDEIDKNINDVDLIVMCCPLGSYKDILSKIVPIIKTKCIITDVGSTKVSVMKDFNNCQLD